ncbi:CHAT domain-containing protein [Cupriavidus numazuensis]|uniref:CHAT domain-containing protein n=1 Tax=Cupriavidus numazuensis TaxID=221992 RepID=A0ABM8TL50_9BURK|nr:CHAT domain-containing protein [Cupriavidus numazuensis]CAG2152938.1 hypothetical protein LMG26411_04307 [Cupriavidus numazuensis]
MLHPSVAWLAMALLASGVARAQASPDAEFALPEQSTDRTAALEQQASLPEPADGDSYGRCVFFHKRGVTNVMLGRYAEAISDFQKALALNQPSFGARNDSNAQSPASASSSAVDEIGQWCLLWRIHSDLQSAYGAFGDNFARIELLKKMGAELENKNVRRFFFTQIHLIDSYIRLGMLKQADETLKLASSLLPKIKKTKDWATQEFNVLDTYNRYAGWMAALHGNYDEAERLLRISLDYSERYLRDNMDTRMLRVARLNVITRLTFLAWICSVQGKSGEAEYFAKEALNRTLAIYALNTTQTSRALSTLSTIYLQQGKISEAARYAELSLQTLEKSGVAAYSDNLSDRRADLALIRNMEGRWPEAVRLFNARAKGVRSNTALWEQIGARHLEWAMALLKTGQTAKAVEMLQRSLEGRSKRPFNPPLSMAYVKGYLGAALAASGDNERALAQFREALPVLLQEAPHGAGTDESGRVHTYRMHIILDAYLALLATQQASGKPGHDWASEAFQIADIARDSSVQRALAASVTRAALPDANLADLARRAQDDANRIQALNKVLSNALSGKQHSDEAITALRQELVNLTAEEAALRQEIAKRFPAYAELVDPHPANAADIQRILAPNEALVSIYSDERQTYVWTITAKHVSWRVVPVSLDDLSRDVARLRKTLDLESGRPKPFDVATAQSLYKRLLAPDAGQWADATVLNVIPYHALGELPFGVLLTSTEGAAAPASGKDYVNMPWLISKVAIVQQSSATAFVAQRNARAAQEQRNAFVGFGDPQFRKTSERSAPPQRDETQPLTDEAKQTGLPDLPRLPTMRQAFDVMPPLPDTATELKEIARILGANPERDLFFGVRASKANVKRTDLSRYRVIAFATHGLKAGELAGLDQPALALSNPAVTGEAGDDGFLKLEDVLGLKLNADWVVLSACNTASPDGSGVEAVSGLGRGFFYAGARSLLVSNWAVESESARLLITGVFRQQAAQPTMVRAEALRQSMLDLMKLQSAKYGHPVYWAPFSLVGNGS